MHLSVIIPIYNEERSLYENILRYYDYLSKQDYSYEIILVNDGSSDTSRKIIMNLQKKIDLKFIDNQKNKGKGHAVRQGLVVGKGDYRMFIDADNATSIDHLDLVWTGFREGADIVIGTRSTRDVEGASQNIAQVFWKRFLGIGVNLLIQLVLVRGVWDTQCGFKVFKKSFVEKIISKARVDRWAVDAEILALAQKYNYKIKKIPVSWNNSDYSRVGVKGYFISLLELLKIKKNIIFGKYD